MCIHLEKDMKFVINEKCMQAFAILKNNLMIKALILTSTNWELPFQLMCDASDAVVGALLGQ